MKILAIETSCDDTGIAVLEILNLKFEVLSNIISSQIKIHEKYGGVFPFMAQREHQKNLVPVLKESLRQAKILKTKDSKQKNQNHNSKSKTIKKILEREPKLLKQLLPFLENYEKPSVDLIAVTNGPGLEPCLWVGVNFAKALSYFWNVSIIPVNHIEAHILANFLKDNLYHNSHGRENYGTKFPAIALVVSGGHTQLILMKGIGKYKIIGETRDDAAGECFDKAAKILGLGYPGGPIISEIASKANNPPRPIELPRPMINTKDYDFSFSGLKTAILYSTRGKTLTEQNIEEICTEIQQAIIDVLIKKTMKAAKDFKAKTIILGGGVSANSELRKQFETKAKKENLEIIYPEKSLSTDNALMIGVAAIFHKNKKTKNWKKIKANSNLRIK